MAVGGLCGLLHLSQSPCFFDFQLRSHISDGLGVHIVSILDVTVVSFDFVLLLDLLVEPILLLQLLQSLPITVGLVRRANYLDPHHGRS